MVLQESASPENRIVRNVLKDGWIVKIWFQGSERERKHYHVVRNGNEGDRNIYINNDQQTKQKRTKQQQKNANRLLFCLFVRVQSASCQPIW